MIFGTVSERHAAGKFDRRIVLETTTTGVDGPMLAI